MTGLLRNHYGYDGLVISDSLGMVSVTRFEPDLWAAAVRTLRAGSTSRSAAGRSDPAPVIDRIVASVESGVTASVLTWTGRSAMWWRPRRSKVIVAAPGPRRRRLSGLPRFDRRPAAETSCWIAQLASGLVPRATFTRDLSLSAEWVGRNVDERYEQALHRQPTTSERAYWIGAIRNGRRSLTALTSGLFGSNECLHLSGGTIDSWLGAVYRQFRHAAPDAAGVAYWRAAAVRHGRPWVAQTIDQSATSRSLAPPAG